MLELGLARLRERRRRTQNVRMAMGAAAKTLLLLHRKNRSGVELCDRSHMSQLDRHTHGVLVSGVNVSTPCRHPTVWTNADRPTAMPIFTIVIMTS